MKRKYEMIVLAVSPSEGGYCLAGITQSGEFIRPIFKDRHSYSFPKEFIHSKRIKLFSLIEFWGIPKPEDFHPEDVKISSLEELKIKYDYYYSWKNIVEKFAMDIEDFEEYLNTKAFERNKVPVENYKGESIFIVKTPKDTEIVIEPHRNPQKQSSKEAFLVLPTRRIKVTAFIQLWSELKPYSSLKFTEDSYVLITLTRPYTDGYCYLLVSGILTDKNHRDLFEVISIDW